MKFKAFEYPSFSQRIKEDENKSKKYLSTQHLKKNIKDIVKDQLHISYYDVFSDTDSLIRFTVLEMF